MITLIGYDGQGPAPAARSRLAAATLVCGAERHLSRTRVPPSARTVVMGDVDAAVQALLGHDGDSVVLTSGDPGFFGILRRLRAAGVSPEVHPAVSSVALAFARAGIDWSDARIVSAHGRDPGPALAAVRAGGKLAVLTDARTGPAEVAAVAPPGARLVVCERLGQADERVTCGRPHEIAGQRWTEPNVVLVLTAAGPAATPWASGPPPPGPGWALPESAFAHRDGMVTKAEVRALALARLGPQAGQLIWDVGAGSGSVAVECARLGAAVVAVERADPSHLHANAARHGVHLQVVTGEAPAVLGELPDPDAVFVGGGGAQVGDIVSACVARGPRIVVVALAALDRLAGVRRALAPYAVDGVQLSAARLRPLGEACGLAAVNPVLLLWGTRP